MTDTNEGSHSMESEFGVEVELGDGNAFAILGACKRAAARAGIEKERIDTFLKEAMAGDYDHLLRTCMKYFDVA